MLIPTKYNYAFGLLKFILSKLNSKKSVIPPIINEWTESQRKIYNVILKDLSELKTFNLNRAKERMKIELVLAISTLSEERVAELLEKNDFYSKRDQDKNQFLFKVSISDLRDEIEYFEALIFAYDSYPRFHYSDYGSNYPGDFAEGIITREIENLVNELKDDFSHVNSSRIGKDDGALLDEYPCTSYKDQLLKRGMLVVPKLSATKKLLIIKPCLENHVFLGNLFCWIEFEDTSDGLDKISRIEFVLPFPARNLYLESVNLEDFKVVEFIDAECISNQKITKQLRNKFKIIEVIKN